MKIRTAYTVIVVMILSISSNVFSQDFLDLFRNYIPETVLRNPEYREAFAAKLKAKAELHPDLIYLNIIQIQRMLLDTSVTNRREFAAMVYRKENEFRRRRNTWMQEQITALQNSAVEFTVQEEGRELISAFYSETVDTIPENILSFDADRNLQKYFAFVYLQNDSNLQYDPVTKYEDLLKAYYSAELDRLSLQVKQAANDYSIDAKELIGKLLQNWFLTDETDSIQVSVPISTAIGQLLTRNISMDFYSRFLVQAGGFHFGTQMTIDRSFLFHYDDPPFPPPIPEMFRNSFPAELKTHALELWSLSVSYRYPVKQQIGFLSYINSKIRLARGSMEADIDQVVARDHRTYRTSWDTFDYTFVEELHLRHLDQTMNIYTFSVSAPFAVVERVFFFEASLNCDYIQSKTVMTYDNRLTKFVGAMISPMGPYTVTKLDMGGNSGTFEHNQNYVLFYPTLDLSWQVSSQIIVTFGAGNKYASLNGGIHF